MNIRTTIIASSLVAAGVVTSTAHATLLPRDLDGNQTTAEAYYDDVLNITWLADANYAKTSGYDTDGLMTWDAAITWAANLSFTDGINVYDNWRLPTVKPVNGVSFNTSFSYDGSTDTGYNITSPQSELAYMFYVNLGNPSNLTPAIEPTFCYQVALSDTCLKNVGPFANLLPRIYYSATEEPPNVFGFLMFYGAQTTGSGGSPNNAWAVSPGDIGQPVSSNIPPLANAGTGQTVAAGTTVILSGAGSSDQDNNNPLTYAWTIVSAPAGSAAALSDATSVSPSFVADAVGDYGVRLTVTDSLGLASTPAQVTISTYNTTPVAAAGADQAILLAGSVVQLDGSQSFDDDGNTFTARWTFTSKPAGSNASLSNPDALNPTFVADVHGNYVLSLTATDSFGAVSAPDSVTIAFDNVVPVAHAGNNQASDTGMTIVLDGTASSDANNDNLTYSWSFASKPATSAATMANPSSDRPSFVADAAGTYIVSLVVNDGTTASLPSTVEIVIVDSAVSVVRDLQDDINIINTLNPASFNNANNQKALTNKLNSVITLIQDAIASGNADLYQSAIDKLTNDVLKKTDGCAVGGKPDKNDWIKNCTDQSTVYPLIIDAIQKLQSLL